MTTFKPQSPARVPAPDIMIDAVRITKSEVLLCVPSFVEEWSKSPESVAVLQQTKGVVSGTIQPCHFLAEILHSSTAEARSQRRPVTSCGMLVFKSLQCTGRQNTVS